MSVVTASTETDGRRALIRQAFRLEYITLAWMTIEAAVAIGFGIIAGSLTLTAFGIDSLIELASATVLIWRLSVELRNGQVFADKAERTASRIGGALLFALAAYVIAGAGWKLWMRQGAEFSLPGLIIGVLAIPIMYFLSRRKLRVADALGSRALRADAVESITCGWLAFVVVGALLTQHLVGAWWVDALASLAIVWFVIREGREAWKGEDCSNCRSASNPDPPSARRSAKPFGATLRCAPPALALHQPILKGGQLFGADPGQRFGAD